MSEPIQVEYKGETVTYSEFSERWCWNAEQFYASQLKEVKERIDKRTKAKFERFEVYYRGFNVLPRLVTVTSITEDGQDVWISDAGSRQKVALKSKCLYEVSDANAELIAAAQVYVDEQAELSKKIEAIKAQLTYFTFRTSKEVAA